jgi:hypothetical protein
MELIPGERLRPGATKMVLRPEEEEELPLVRGRAGARAGEGGAGRGGAGRLHVYWAGGRVGREAAGLPTGLAWGVEVVRCRKS